MFIGLGWDDAAYLKLSMWCGAFFLHFLKKWVSQEEGGSPGGWPPEEAHISDFTLLPPRSTLLRYRPINQQTQRHRHHHPHHRHQGDKSDSTGTKQKDSDDTKDGDGGGGAGQAGVGGAGACMMA